MAFQFAHIQTYSIKGNTNNRSVAEICAEAARIPGNHLHVAKPLPPTLIAGEFLPEQVPEEIERRIAEAKERNRGKDRKTRLVIRRDTHVLEAQVYSHPAYVKRPPEEHDGEDRACLENEADHAAYIEWRNATVEFAFREAKRRGLEVLSVVEHLDEEHPHVHALLVPTNAQLNAKLSHPGHQASEVAKDDAKVRGRSLEELAAAKDAEPSARAGRKGGDSARPLGSRGERQKQPARNKAAGQLTEGKILQKIGNRAYQSAMRDWQDLYHEEVGVDAGLLRIGPGRARWSRREYMERKQDARGVATVRRNAKAAEDRAREAEKKVQEFEDAIAPGSSLHTGMERIAQDAMARTNAASENLAALQPELERATAAISSAAELDELLRRRREEEAELEKKLEKLRDEATELAQENAKLAAVISSGEQAQIRLQEVEDKLAIAKSDEKSAKDNKQKAEQEAQLAGIEARATEARLKRREEGIRKREDEVERIVTEAKSSQEQAEAKLAGVEAWRDGIVVLGGENLVFRRREDHSLSADPLLNRIKPVREWLHGTISRLERKVDSRAQSIFNKYRKDVRQKILEVVDTIVEAWASGSLRKNVSGKLVIAGDDRKKFKATVAEWAELVGPIFRRLPSLSKFEECEKEIERVQPMLSEAERNHVMRIKEQLQRSRGRGFDPDL